MALHRAINGLREDDPLQFGVDALDGLAAAGVVGATADHRWLRGLAPMPTAVALIGICTLGYVLTMLDRVLIFRRGLASRPIVVTDEEARAIPDEALPRYTILVPAYDEPEVVDDLIGAMAQLEYPRGQVAGAPAAGGRRRRHDQRSAGVRGIRQHQPSCWCRPPNRGPSRRRATTACTSPQATSSPSSTPRICQSRCSCAGWSPHSHRLPDDVACVQAKLAYHNGHQNLLTGWFTAEYGLWFGYLLPGMMRTTSPIPLGGTSNHLASSVLDEIGTWDPYNVTEDADLGLRIAASGYRTAVVDSETLEEANSDPINWIRQRSRWYKGYLQTWLVHIRRTTATVAHHRPA